MEANNNKELSTTIHKSKIKFVDNEAYIESSCNVIHDTRIIVKTPKNLPYCYFGIISVGDNFVGTGFIVGPNLVLTAAHNINHSHLHYLKLPNAKPSEVKFSIPAEDSFLNDYKYTKYSIKKIYTPLKYEDFLFEHSCHDWALLELEEPIGLHIFEKYKKKWLNLLELNEGLKDDLPNYGITVAGFTREHQIEGAPHGTWILLKMEGTRIIQNGQEYPGMFGYKIHTTKGQSGGPVIIEKNCIRYICGIHQGSGKKITKENQAPQTDSNWCTGISKEIIEMIEEINKITIDPPMQRRLVNIYLMQYINKI